MKDLQVFNFQDKKIRTVIIDGDPWFVAKDVCEVLEIGNDRMATSRLSETMKGVSTVDTLGGPQEMVVISEAGVYKLVFTSRKPEAEIFTDFIASEVVPTIRKHGAYMTPETIEKTLTNPDFIIGLAMQLKAEQAKVQALAPKAAFFDQVADSKDAVSIRDAAKVLNMPGIGQNKLFAILREQKILMKDNTPYQEFCDRGYFRLIEQKYSNQGEVCIRFKTLVYQKGLAYIRRVIEAGQQAKVSA